MIGKGAVDIAKKFCQLNSELFKHLRSQNRTSGITAVHDHFHGALNIDFAYNHIDVIVLEFMPYFTALPFFKRPAFNNSADILDLSTINSFTI